MMGLTVLVSVIAWLTARHILHDFVERRREAQEEQAQLLVRSCLTALARVQALVRETGSPAQYAKCLA